MPLVRDTIEGAVKLLTERPPMLPKIGSGAIGTGPLSGLTGGSRLTQLQAFEGVSHLFGVVDKIATSVAATDWDIAAQGPDGKPGQPIQTNDPVRRLWEQPNPFYDPVEFRETTQQHLSLTGEAYWVLLRQSVFDPVTEIWPVRPDRMTPVPDQQKFIKGYMYRLGSELIALEPDDVIMFRRPSPTDHYRGASPVASLMTDIEAEKMASLWTRNFFRNDASPGGIVQFEKTLSREEWEEFVYRWETAHKGPGNAHKVAILEQGKWVDRKFTMREMQFDALRKLHRDLIFEVYGVPKGVMGITEDVNRANAEAGELIFAKWVILPILRRWRSKLNHSASKLTDKPVLWVFTDPTPANRELDIREGTEGYEAGILTLNESRERFGEEPVSEGEGFKPAPAVPTFGMEPEELSVSAVERKGLLAAAKNEDDLEAYPDEVNSHETKMDRAWRKRLSDEADAIAAFLESIDEDTTLAGWIPTKVEPSDLAGYDWDWWAKYGAAVVEELTDSFTFSFNGIHDAADEALVQQYAAEYARVRGASLLQLDGEINIVTATRTRVSTLVADALENGDSLGTLTRSIRDDDVFSAARARMVARTETATALGQGQRQAAQELGRDEKRWVVNAADDDICLGNQAQGWITLGDVFQSGHDTIPAHPHCECNVVYRTNEDGKSAGVLVSQAAAMQTDRAMMGADEVLVEWNAERETFDLRCPADRKLMAREERSDTFTAVLQTLYCRRCKRAYKGKPEPPKKAVRKTITRNDEGRISEVLEEEV